MPVPTMHCTVVEVTPRLERFAEEQPLVRDLLPWADPYIAQLIAKHHVQMERQLARDERLAAEPWWNDMSRREADFEDE